MLVRESAAFVRWSTTRQSRMKVRNTMPRDRERVGTLLETQNKLKQGLLIVFIFFLWNIFKILVSTLQINLYCGVSSSS